MNWWLNSSVTGLPSCRKSASTSRSSKMKRRYAQWASDHLRPCSTYVSSSTMCASSGAKSAAVELGKSWFSVSSKPSGVEQLTEYVQPLYVAFERAIDVK